MKLRPIIYTLGVLPKLSGDLQRCEVRRKDTSKTKTNKMASTGNKELSTLKVFQLSECPRSLNGIESTT